jgi:hypothetical protein
MRPVHRAEPKPNYFMKTSLILGTMLLSAVVTLGAEPHLQPLLQGKWPKIARGPVNDLKVAGNYAYLVLDVGALAVVDVSDPTNCVHVGGFNTRGNAWGAAVVGNYAYVADGPKGLVVLCSLPNVQYLIRVHNATAGLPCVIEASPVLGPAAQWTPVHTNIQPSGPFEFTDFDVWIADHPQKFYRARQP